MTGSILKKQGVCGLD